MAQLTCALPTRQARLRRGARSRLPPRAAPALAFVLLLASAACTLAEGPSSVGPFVFVHGLQGPDAVETASALGCSAIFLDLPQDAPLRLGAVRTLIQQAAEADLAVIVGLRTKLDGQYPISPTDERYHRAIREWLQAVMGGLRDTRGLTAWATDHYLERDIRYSDADFRDYLLRTHGSLQGINALWGTDYVSLGQINRAMARELDLDQTFGVGRPSIALAEYQRCAFRDVMQLWAEEIRRLDPERLLLTGRVSLYRSLAAIPDAYDVVMPSMPPDILEPDKLTHNVHAVQMARRGGRFAVLPWLRIPLPPSELYAQDALTSWILEAGLRGAIGIGFEDWSRMSVGPAVQHKVQQQLAAALGAPMLFHEPPSPPMAVIHQPYAGGREFVDTPAYGYLDDFAVPDFAALAYAYRRGTIFGGFDSLCLQDIAQVDLDRYSAILAPLCLKLPASAAAALDSYVRRGGALMADLGLGMYETNSWDPAAGPLAALFGLAESLSLEPRLGDLRVGNPHSKLPSVRVGLQSSGTFVPGQPQSLDVPEMYQTRFDGAATAMKGYAFSGPSCFVRLRTGAVPLATMSVRFDQQQRPFFLSLTANDSAAGLALFGCYPLWSYWPPQDSLHAALHLDLIARRASYRLLHPGLAAGQVELAGSGEAVHLYNRGEQTTAEVLAGKADHRAYLGAVTTCSAAERDSSGRRTGVVRLTMDLPPAGLAHAALTRIRVRPFSGQASVRVICYSAGLVSMQVGGDGSRLTTRRGAPPEFTRGTPTQIRFTLEDGAYPIPPGSQHEVTWRDNRERPQAFIATADYRGRLEFSLVFSGGDLSLKPASPSASSAN